MMVFCSSTQALVSRLKAACEVSAIWPLPACICSKPRVSARAKAGKRTVPVSMSFSAPSVVAPSPCHGGKGHRQGLAELLPQLFHRDLALAGRLRHRRDGTAQFFTRRTNAPAFVDKRSEEPLLIGQREIGLGCRSGVGPPATGNGFQRDPSCCAVAVRN